MIEINEKLEKEIKNRQLQKEMTEFGVVLRKK